MSMRAGKLRHRILIQEPIESLIGGQRIVTWNHKGNYWADVVMKNSSEPNQDQVTKSVITYQVTMRYQQLSSKARIIWNHRVLHISGIIEDPRKTSITCTCTSVDGERVELFYLGSGGIKTGGSHG